MHCLGCLLLENSQLNGNKGAQGLEGNRGSVLTDRSPGSCGFSYAVDSDPERGRSANWEWGEEGMGREGNFVQQIQGLGFDLV